MKDPERIWLQNADDARVTGDRLWCQDKVWPECAEQQEPTEYIRADLCASRISQQDAELERLRREVEAVARCYAGEMKTTAGADFSVEPAKALEWRLNEEGWQIADTFFGGYRVERNPHDHWCWGVFFHGEAGVGLNSADNFEAAKAAAQADFNERISSSLDAKPAPDFRDLIIVGDTAYPVHSEVCRAFNA